MFPLPINSWIMISLAVLAISGVGYGKYESNKYTTYKTNIEAQVKTQEAQIESLKKQQILVNQSTEKEYNAKIALIRQYYANGVQSSSRKMPGLSSSSSISDATTIYNVLAEQCTETTQQLVSLTEWINAQLGLQKQQ